MGTKVYDNALDLITFTRASGGTALRKISYGPELVDTLNQATSWQVYGSNTVEQDGDAVKITYIDNGSGAYDFLSAAHGTSEDLVVGKVYKMTLKAKVNSGSSVIVRLFGTSLPLKDIIVSSETYVNLEYVFVGEAGHLINTPSMGSGEIIWLKDFSVKEVLFDRPDGTLTLFNHPTNVPRIEYDASGAVKGLLVEEARTNLLLRSEEFDNLSVWANLTSVIVADATSAPDGTTAADKFAGSVGSTNIRLSQALSLVGGQTYTYSIWAKASEYSTLRVQRQTTALDLFTHTFDLSAGTASGGGGISAGEDGWYRCFGTIFCNTTATTGPLFVAQPGATGDGTSGLFIYGAQLEAGSFSTSYIPTAGATATRAADIASIPVSAFGYNQKAGSVVIEAQTFSTAVNNHQDFNLHQGVGASNSIHSGSRVGSGVAGQYALWVQSGGSTVALISKTSAISDNTVYKAAWAAAADDFALTVNGAAVTTDTAGAMPVAATEARIGYGVYGRVNGHIRSIAYYPRRLSNAQLQELTS